MAFTARVDDKASAPMCEVRSHPCEVLHFDPRADCDTWLPHKRAKERLEEHSTVKPKSEQIGSCARVREIDKRSTTRGLAQETQQACAACRDFVKHPEARKNMKPCRLKRDAGANCPGLRHALVDRDAVPRASQKDARSAPRGTGTDDPDVESAHVQQ
jgi:hypothetical protein